MMNNNYSAPVGRKPKTPPNERAAWVRHVRENVARLSQDEFADAIGVERPTVSNWERGRYVPEWASIEKILKRFPQAPSPAFGANGPMSDPDRTLVASSGTGDYTVKTDQGRIIAKLLDGIDDEGERTRALQKCLNVLSEQQHPSELGAEQRPGRAQRR